MTVRRWTITTYATGKRRDVDLVLYDSVSRMRGEATRFAKHVGEKTGHFKDSLGVCHGFSYIRIHPDGSETEHPRAALIRFNTDNLTPLVISHEIAHAAQHLYGLDVLKDDDQPADLFTSGNEDFAYILGELFNAAWSALPVKRKDDDV